MAARDRAAARFAIALEPDGVRLCVTCNDAFDDWAAVSLRCVTHPDPAQAALLDRLGIVLPKRMRISEQTAVSLAAIA